MTYPIRYVKDDRQQWAGSPTAQVRLEHDGWHQEQPAAPPPDQAADTTTDAAGGEPASDQAPEAAPVEQPKPRTTRRTKTN